VGGSISDDSGFGSTSGNVGSVKIGGDLSDDSNFDGETLGPITIGGGAFGKISANTKLPR